MNLFLKFLEKALTSLIISFIILFASFSFMTGRFPPRKEDMTRAASLFAQMMTSTKQYNDQASAANQQAGPPSLEQLVELQRLGLKRSEVSLELQKIFKRLPTGNMDDATATKLRAVSENLRKAEEGLIELNAGLKALVEKK